MPTASRNVRFRGQSGKQMLALSFSGFDPSRKRSLDQRLKPCEVVCWELCSRIASVQRSNWRLSMGFAPVIPGQQDVNDAYSPPNLSRTKREFQTLKDS